MIIPSCIYKLTKREKLKRVNQFHRTAEELRELEKENNIKLLELLRYMRRRNDKKIKKGGKYAKGDQSLYQKKVCKY